LFSVALEEEESWVISKLGLEVSSGRQTLVLRTIVASVTARFCVPAGVDAVRCVCSGGC